MTIGIPEIKFDCIWRHFSCKISARNQIQNLRPLRAGEGREKLKFFENFLIFEHFFVDLTFFTRFGPLLSDFWQNMVIFHWKPALLRNNEINAAAHG